MAYDIKFREKVMRYIDNGHTIQEAHEVFGVGTTTIKEWKKLKKETGKLDKRPAANNALKICPDQLKAYVEANPDSYQSEIADVFKCTQPAIFYALQRLQMKRKKND